MWVKQIEWYKNLKLRSFPNICYLQLTGPTPSGVCSHATIPPRIDGYLLREAVLNKSGMAIFSYVQYYLFLGKKRSRNNYRNTKEQLQVDKSYAFFMIWVTSKECDICLSLVSYGGRGAGDYRELSTLGDLFKARLTSWGEHANTIASIINY